MTTTDLVRPASDDSREVTPRGALAALQTELEPEVPAARPLVVRVDIRERHELLEVGWEQVLARAPGGGFHVSPTDARQQPEVTLYGVRRQGRSGDHDPELHRLLRTTRSRVIVTHWEDTPDELGAALRCGAHGALSRRLPQTELIAGIEAVLAAPDDGGGVPAPIDCHPEVAAAGLTPRELDVLVLVASGLTNQEIADRLFLTINTVKTYIRCGYRKIGVERRSHAVVWADRHGLAALAGEQGLASGDPVDTTV